MLFILFGDIIKNIRNNNGLTQEQFSELIYCSVQSLSNWERNISIPSINTFNIISKKFNVPIDYMFNNEELDTEKYIFNLCKKFLENKIVPKTEDIKKNIIFNESIVDSYFNSDSELIIFIIEHFDKNIKNKLLLNIKSYNSILTSFIDNGLPLIIKNKPFLKPLYLNKYSNGIIGFYLKDSYYNYLSQFLGDSNELTIRLLISDILEIINASLTYYDNYSIIEIKSICKQIFSNYRKFI